MHQGDVLGGRFELDRRAGAGGSGTVWRAVDRLRDTPVAVKILHRMTAHVLDRFAREAHVLAEIAHPAIVRYVAHGAGAGGDLYLAMEWLEGESLGEHLARRRPTADESVALAARVAEALAVAHARGVVHRDIKPSNLFLVDGRVEEVKIIDFGVARLLAPASRITLTGDIVGTPGYMSPEQARGAPDVDARSDVFSLGAVLFKCLTGRGPFVGDDALSILLKIVLEEAPRVVSIRPSVPPALDAIVAHMLAKSAADRPSDAAALASALRAIEPVGGDEPCPLPSEPAPAALTTGEKRFVSVVLARTGEATPPTVGAELAAAPYDWSAALAPLMVSVEVLANGSVVVVPASRLPATDRAVAAARAALALRRALPAEEPVVLATGRRVVGGRSPVGEAIDRATQMLEQAPGPGVAVDEVTAVLLAGRFDVRDTAAGRVLLAEHESAAPARTILGRPSPFMGRERDLAALLAVLDECIEETTARAVLVTAGAGVGKSRLCYELLARIAERGIDVRVFVGRGDPMAAGAPFGILASALRDAAGISAGESAETRARKLLARVGLHVPEPSQRRVAEFLGEVCGAELPGEPSAERGAARADPILMGDQVRLAFQELLLAECAASPVLLVLEDLHWGDLPSVKLVEAALRRLRDRRFLLLAFARPEVERLFPDLCAGTLRRPLGELSAKASTGLVRAVLGDAMPEATVRRIVEQAAGNAFCLEELMRGAVEGRGDTAWETVLAMVESRLAALDVEARRFLRAASVFGDQFQEDGVRALLGEDVAARAGAVLDDLVEREVLVVRAGAREARACAFRHALVREAAYGMLTEADRALGHRLASGWLERSGEADPQVIAEHHERGGALAAARRWLRRAAEKALEANDFASVIACADRAIALGAEGDDRGALRLRQAQAHAAVGRNVETEACAIEAMALLAEGSPLWCEAAGEASLARGRLGHDERALALGRRVLAVVSAAAPPREGLLTAARVAQHLLLAGCDELAAALLARVEASPLFSAGDPVLVARVLLARGHQMRNAGDPSTAADLFQRAAVDVARVGDARFACLAHVSAGLGRVQIGAYAEAEAAFREARETADRLGLHTARTLAEHNLGLVLARRGHRDEGLRMLRAVANVYEEAGNRRMEKATRVYLAIVSTEVGEHEEAEREARAACDPTAPDGIRAHGLAALAASLRAQGRVTEALDAARGADAILRARGALEEGEAAVRLALVECLQAAGEPREALGALAEARRRILERAARIQHPQHRDAFLTDVPENARTLAFARERLGPPDKAR